MANNTQAGTGTGDPIRDIDKTGTTGAKVVVSMIDVGVGTAEVLVTQNNPMPVSLADGAGHNVSVFQSHNADNQVQGGTFYAINTGGVAQLINAVGNLDRQRETGFDGIGAAGVPAGSQQLSVPVSTTIASSVATGSQTVTPASMTGIAVGSVLQIANSNGSNSEKVFVTAITPGTNFTATFASTKTGPGITVNGFTYNQARDATSGDNIALTGLQAGMTYLYNAVSGNAEMARPASGELDGATGRGTAVAAEYEWNGNPPNGTSSLSGSQFDRARNVQAKGKGAGTLANNPLAAASTTLTLNTAPPYLSAGQTILIDRAGANPETNMVAGSYAGGTSVPLQFATVSSHAQNATVEWDVHAPLGPGSGAFLAHGVGVEVEAIYDAASKQYYGLLAATGTGVSGTNIPLEAPALQNASGTYDPEFNAAGDAILGTVLGDGRQPKDRSIEADIAYAYAYNGTNWSRLRVDSAGNNLAVNAQDVVEQVIDKNGNAYAIQRATINTAASGDTVVVTGTASKRIVVLSFRYKVNGTTNVAFKSSGGTVIYPAAPETQFGGSSGGYNPAGHMATLSGEGLTINSSVATQVSGILAYILIP